MKIIISSMALVLTAFNLIAGTPAETLVNEYKDVKGARNLVAKGAVMNMARPMLKKYSIAPLAHKVEEMSVLRMDRANEDMQQRFMSDMQKVLAVYIYAGKSDTPNGIVDAYVHLASDTVADELIVYNPEIVTLYSLSGEFTIEELQSIQKPVADK